MKARPSAACDIQRGAVACSREPDAGLAATVLSALDVLAVLVRPLALEREPDPLELERDPELELEPEREPELELERLRSGPVTVLVAGGRGGVWLMAAKRWVAPPG